jgi:hypothetical protein
MTRKITRMFTINCILFAIALLGAAATHSAYLACMAAVALITAAGWVQFPLEFSWLFEYKLRGKKLCWECYREAIAGRGVIADPDIAACKAAQERAEEARFFGYDIGHRPNRREW